ncbi:MAG: PspA/IM30 family protein [Proteobacteria bacterium]|nr:PspA/IM30 family protein [Pseudomonadota bacterium]
MALITRLSRLFQADFHAVLDRIEEPDIQLKQAIREMQFELQQDQQRLALLQHEAEALADLAAQTEQQLDEFDDELDICFSAKKDNLARDLIRRKLEAERRLHTTEQQGKANQTSLKNLQQRIGENHQALDNMKQKLDLLSDGAGGSTRAHISSAGIRSEEIEIAFLREKQKRAAS